MYTRQRAHTFTVQTRDDQPDRLHVYFRMPGGMSPPRKAGVETLPATSMRRMGMDLKGATSSTGHKEGFIVLPGQDRPDGHGAYRALRGDPTDLAVIDPRLLEHLSPVGSVVSETGERRAVSLRPSTFSTPGQMPEPGSVSDGARNDFLYRKLCGRRAGSYEELLVHAHGLNTIYCNPPHVSEEVERVTAEAWKKVQQHPPPPAEPELEPDQEPEPETASEPPPSAGISRVQPRSAVGVCAALEHLAVGIRLNLRGCIIEYRRGDGDWLPMSDNARAKLREDVAEAFMYDDGRGDTPPWRITDRLWDDFVRVVAQERPADPFAAWLADVPAWDGEARLDDLLIQYFCVGNDVPFDLLSWASSAPIIAAAQRARQPGSEFPHMVVLTGITRDEHLEYWRCILPSAWVGQQLDLRSQEWVQAMDLARSVVSDCGGLADSRAAGRALRRLVPSSVDRIDRVDVARRAVVVASSANHDCLPIEVSEDSMCVPIAIVDHTGWWPTDRDQLWAEALVRAESFTGHLPATLRAGQRAVSVTSVARPDDSFEKIATWARANPDAVLPAWAITKEAGCPHKFEGRLPTSLGRTVGVALRSVHPDWHPERRRFEGVPTWCWVGPESVRGRTRRDSGSLLAFPTPGHSVR